MNAALNWDIDGRDWPNRESSRFVRAQGLEWHVQVMGEGPVLLLLHGTGASTHSWRDVAPLLAKSFKVVAPDLPGHGFSALPSTSGLAMPAMARSIAALLKAMDVAPQFIVGHSSGAAIATRMCLDAGVAPRAIIGLNAALLPFPGFAAVAFPVLAKMMFLNPFAVPIITRMADDPEAIRRLIRGTGSTLNEEGYRFYHRLMASERHITATTGMLAVWDLETLKRDLPRLECPLTLIAASGDLAVPPRKAKEAATLVRQAQVIRLQELGHLAHEESPAVITKIIEQECLRYEK